jgi:3-oxo-4-pregnene-20-carboxyl-CoA dehydrogenase alpha subunit
MDFTPGEAETEVAKLAGQILARTAGPAAADGPVPVPSADGPPFPGAADFDAVAWKELADAGLLSLALPADLGGAGLGMQATAAVLTETGRYATRVPALATLALGVLPVTRSTDPGLRRQLLDGVAAGDTILTAALREPSDPLPDRPDTTVSTTVSTTISTGGGHRAMTVSGRKIGVPYAAAARWILVPASMDSGGGGDTSTVVAVVEPDADGLSCQRTRSSSGLPEYTLWLEQTPVFGILPDCTAADLSRLAIAGACAVADGVLAAALDLTTEHVRSREQFGRPLATFQAVAQQIADVYAAARTLHLATISVCWQLDAGREAGKDADIAAYWLAQHGPAAVRTCHHLHGGLGMDVSYPLPRYSALLTDLVALVGGLDDRLDRLSRRELMTAGDGA